MAFEIASQVLLGIASSEKDAQDINQLFILCAKGMEGLHPLFPTRLPWTPFGRALAAHVKLIQYIKQIIHKRIQTPAHDGISLMIQAYNTDGKGIDIEELAEYVLFFLWAGHESVTSFSTSFCLEMALHPDILQHAREEQRVLEGSDLALLEKVKQMEYLNQIVLEVERFHPPFTGSLRGVVKPFDYQGFSVPAGWRVIWSIAGTHRIDTLYPDPGRFDPDRFHAVPVSQMRHNFHLAGFGGGVRSCLGRDFARLEVKLLASHLLRKYRWHLLSRQRPDQTSTPNSTWPPHQPRDGLRVSFQRL
jgi:cytochrome P450